MAALFKHLWVAFILTTVFNAAIWWVRGKAARTRDPSLAASYQSLVRGLVVWGNVPWFVMGIGVLLGDVPTTFHFFTPETSNPFIMSWYASVVLLWVLGTYWLFARGGAEQLIRHPGLIHPDPSSPAAIKTFWLVGVAGGVVALVLMLSGSFPISGPA